MPDHVLKQKTPQINAFLEKTSGRWKAQILQGAINYSLLGGGKRFRPALCLVMADVLGLKEDEALPAAAALEMIHTYSLIHDDLPCMDDDDERRGKPTSHKVHGEALALLAGDSLLTEAFVLLADSYEDNPKVAVSLIQCLGECAGVNGMIAGQVTDLEAKTFTKDEIIDMHLKKTGALIKAACLFPGLILQESDAELQRLKEFGLQLGLAFQLADDLHDHDEASPESSSLTKLIGVKKTKEQLELLTNNLSSLTDSWGERAAPLKELVLYNRDRDH